MKKISACIVSYNGADEVIRAVESLLEHTTGCDLRIYLVDNASPDGTGKQLADYPFDQRVQVICLPKNLGFGPGHNQVLPLLDSDYHFVLNPDIFVDSNVLPQMCQWMDEHPQVVMATPKLLFPDGRVQVLPTDGAGCCRALLTAQAPAKRLAGLAARLCKRKPKGE